jgi:hypothetical protein
MFTSPRASTRSLFSTGAAVLLRPLTITQRLLYAIRTVDTAAWRQQRRPPTRRYHPLPTYLEGGRMAREMDRL